MGREARHERNSLLKRALMTSAGSEKPGFAEPFSRDDRSLLERDICIGGRGIPLFDEQPCPLSQPFLPDVSHAVLSYRFVGTSNPLPFLPVHSPSCTPSP